MKSTAALALVCLGQLQSAPAHAQASWRESPTQLQLVDRLDRPSEGYCLDIVGSGGTIRFDMPLVAHNCVPGLYPDRTVAIRRDGSIYFPGYDQCATVMGMNAEALPGAAVMVKPCGQDTPFLEARRFQNFEQRDDGGIALAGTDLCLAVGAESRPTYNRTHRWRTLNVQRCGATDATLARWTIRSAQ